MTPSMSERRRRPRASCTLAASVVSGEPPTARRAELVDVSETGVFLRTSQEVHEGDAVRVVFDAGRTQEPAGTGRVTRLVQPDGVGVHFEEVNEDLRGFVRRLLVACRETHERGNSQR